MADYKVLLGAELKTKDIDAEVKKYNGNVTIGVNPNGITDGITAALKTYKANPIDVGTTLNTQGLTDGITNYSNKKNRKNIKIGVDPDFTGVNTKIESYEAKPLGVKVELNWAGVVGQIKGFQTEEKVRLDAVLNDKAISESIKNFNTENSATKIKVGVEPDFNEVGTKIANHEVSQKLKIHPKLLVGEIASQISSYQKDHPDQYILLDAKLKDQALNAEIDKYKTQKKVPVDLTLGSTTDFDTKVSQKLGAYQSVPIEIPVRLKPASTGFDSQITKKPVKVEAILAPDAINQAIEGHKPTSKMPVEVRLAQPKDINEQVRKLAKPTETIDVGVKLDEKSVNTEISTFKPTSTLGIQPELMFEDVEKQISSYIPKTPIKVNLKVEDSDIDEKTGKPSEQNPINVNVKLDREKINEQIRAFKTDTKIKVGVQLDFASHKDKTTKEYIQKGISQQIKEYETKTKVKVGVELDKDSILQEVNQVNVDTPIRLGVELDPNKLQNVRTEIDDLRRQLQNLPSVNINIGDNRVGARISGGEGQDIQTVRIARGVDDVTRAYRELLSIQNRMGSKQQAVAKLDTTKNEKEILELSNQIDVLARKYQRIHQLFSKQFSNAQIDALNRNFEITAEKLNIIKQKALDAKSSLDGMGTSGGSSATSGASQSPRRQADEAVQAYKELISVLNELDSKRLQLNRLTASSPQSSNEIQTLRLQIEQLGNEYDNLMRSFSIQGIQFTPDQWNQLETAMGRVGRQIDVIQAKMSDKSAIQTQTQAYKELLSVSKEISSLEINIEKLRGQGGNANQINELENQLRTLQSTYQQLASNMETPLTDEQWSSIYTQIAKTSEKLNQLKAKYADTRAELEKEIRFKLDNSDNGLSQFDNEVDAVTTKYNRLSNKDIPELQHAMAELSSAFNRLKEVSKTGTYDELIQSNKEYEAALKAVKTQLDINMRAERDAAADQKLTDDRIAFQSKVDAWLTKNSAAAKKFGSELLELKAQAENCDRTTLNHLEREFKQIDKAAEAAGVRTKTFGDSLKAQFEKYRSYFSVASLFIYGEQALRSMFEQVKLIDSAMTELKKVTNETDDAYNQFLSNAAKRARVLGTTVDGIISSTADFARLGYGFEESQGLAEVANIYAVVGDEIEGVEDATQSLVSTLAAFRSDMGDMSNTDFAMSIVDKMNEVSNNFAISSGGIGQALQRSASSMAAANNTLDETIAMITAANEVAQNPEKVGNAFKTMSMRIRGAKTELEEAGESTDGMAESTASLRQEMLALSGVDIMLNKDTFKSTYQIMDELSHKWEDLSDIAQATIIELVAGKHQGNVFSSLMANFDTARAALDTSLNSSGSAMEEHAKWSESLEARLNKLKAAWQSLSQAFLNSNFLKIVLDSVIALVDGLTSLVEVLGTLGTMGLGVGIFALFKNWSAVILSAKKAIVSLTLSLSLQGGLATAASVAKAAISKLWGVIAAHPILAVVAAIGAVIAHLYKLKQEQEELAQKVDDLTSKFKEQHNELIKGRSSFKQEATRYAQLSKGVDELGRNVSLTSDEYSEYQNIVNNIADKIPSIVAGYDDQGNAIFKVKNSVEDLTKAYEGLINAQNQEILDNGEDIFQDFKNRLKGSSAYHYFEDGEESGWQFDTSHISDLDNILKLREENLNDYLDRLSNEELGRISSLLGEYGIERDILGSGENGSETFKEHIIRALEEDRNDVASILNKASDDINAYASELGTVTDAYFSKVFLSDGKYAHMSDTMQSIINKFVSSLDSEFYGRFLNDENPYESLIDYYDNVILKQFDNIGNDNVGKIESAFELQAKFNSGDISYGEYVKNLEDVGKIIDTFGMSKDLKSQLKLSIGLNKDGFIEEYKTLMNRLVSDNYGIQMTSDNAKKFLDELNASELEVAVDLIASDDVDLSNFNAESLREYIEEQAKLNDALSFKIDIAAETEGIEVLNTAITESVSACGLSQEALGSLQARYEKLDSYDPAKLFERTAQGIHINRDEFNKLEKELANSNLEKIDDSLEEVMEAYEDVTEQIRICSDETERNELLAKQSAYENKIKELSELKAQYEGLTSAYNNWVNAQAAGEEGDIYDDVLEKLESAKELRGKGLVGTNEFAAAVGFMSGKDTSTMTVDQIVSAYEEALPKMDRYFKESSDGAKNLLNDLNNANKEWAFINESGAWEINVPIEEAAKALGISVDALESVLGKGTDYGLTINYDSVYEAVESLETLYTKAESANNKLIELGHTDLTFSFESTDVEDLVSQIENAQNIVDELNKADLADDNKINLSIDGAEDARLVLETLMRQKQEVTKPEIMKISLAMIGDEKLGNVVSSLQELQRYQNTYEIEVATGADTSETETKIQEIVGGLKTLKEQNPEIFTKLGLNTDEFNSSLDTILNTNLEKDVNATLDPDAIKTIQTALSEIDTTVLANVGVGDTTEIDNYNYDQEGKLYLSPVVAELTDEQKNKTGTITYGVKISGFGIANGTANVNGTAFADGTTGKAFKQGSWGIKDSGTALVGELGMETLVRDGKFYTIGDSGAEFIKYRKGDIIFNHLQTKELFEHGKVTSGSGRGKMFANGTAFAIGSKLVRTTSTDASGFGKIYGYTKEYVDKLNKELKTSELNAPSNDAAGGGTLYDSSLTSSSSSSSSSYSEEEFEETFDWIEIAISRLERAINNLDKTANNVYKSWSDRNSALADEIGKVGEEIKLQEDAAQRYLKEANSVGLDANYARMVRDGTIDIENFEGESDEALVEKIKDYQTWYEKYLACIDAAEDLRETESELYAQRFENVQTQYDAILQGYEHTEAMLNEYINQAEEKGYIVSKAYYNALIENEKSNIAELQREQADLIAERDNAVAAGKIVKGSEAWYEQCAAIDEVTQAIEEANTSIIEYNNSIRDIDWQIFDIMQERISDVTEEADFLIELMSNKKLFDDDGKLTSQGLATMGLHAQNYNTNMYQADTYGEEISKLNGQIAKDPYNQDLINRRNELLELQRESILAAEDEKNAIRDMVEEGINLELDALQERIDLHNEELDSMKDLYDYQKRVEESSKNIASLRKQLSAYEGFDDEETRAKVQKLKVSLEEAEADLQEMEYDKYISDQQAMLDTMYNEYELILNTRLDNVDYLLESVIESINAASSADGAIVTALGSEGAISLAISNNATSIKGTLESESNKVGITLSTAMKDIWSSGEGNAKSVLTMYGEDFKTKSATIITTLNGISTSVNSMVASLNKDASKNTTANKTTTSAKANPTTTTTQTPKPPVTTTNPPATSSGGDGKPKVGDKVKFVSGQYYYDSQGTSPLGSSYRGKEVYITSINTKSWATHPYHISSSNKLGKGDLGWLKLDQLSGYAFGKHNFSNSEIAWTQEEGKEFIVRPSDGAILTPIAKGDSVLTSAASKNIWDMANSPAEFIRDNLGIGATNVPNNSNVNNNYTQHFENVTFSMPNVHGYNELLAEMQKDPKFEKLILSMSIDRIAGKSSLAKGKSIR